MKTTAIGCLAVALILTLTSIAHAAGSISGVVNFDGKPRRARKLDRSADPKCLQAHAGDLTDEKFVVGTADGTKHPMANIFVYVKSGLPDQKWPVSDKPVVLDQRGCKYVPHVMGIQVGQTIEIRNSDPTTHNVHSLAKNSDVFNYGQPQGAPALKKTFTAAEVMAKVKCDMHPWMYCYVGVLDHPFHAVTGDDGKFMIDGLPAGTYEIETWQELLKTRTQSVTVKDGEAANVEVVYSKPKKK
jgi:plastocyanin